MTPARLCAPLMLVLLGLMVYTLNQTAQGIGPWGLLFGSDIKAIVVRYSWAPSLAVALLGGAGLGLAGVLLQQTLRNPLASPTTLGVASGAQLALLVATLFAPSLVVWSRGGVAFAGGALALGLVFGLAWPRRLAPTVLVLAGMVVNLYAGTLSLALILFNQEALQGMMIWGAGSLTQDNWSGVVYLLPRLALGLIGALLLSRALALLDLDEVNARNLGVSLLWLRLASLGLAVFVAVCVVARLGNIGFIGLAAPAIVRIAGARTFKARLLWAPVLGALLLALADQALNVFAGSSAMLVPTGAVTAALGAPLLLWLIPRLSMARSAPTSGALNAPVRRRSPRRFIAFLALAALLMAVIGLLVGQGSTGWHWPWSLAWSESGAWRLPRVAAAAAAGMMLALAGTIIQRVSGNPLASPEVLGISAGAGLGLLGLLLFFPEVSTGWSLTAGTIGALATLGLLIAVNARSGFEPERLLLTGISVMFLFTAVQQIVMAGGDPRVQGALAWILGSTYSVSLPRALLVMAVAVALIALARPFAIWLDLLPLGGPTARALGLDVDRSRLFLLLLVSVLTAGATLIVGPLSFVGLLAPHLARILGLSRAREQMAGSIVLGALLMIGADWLGRELIFPFELPSGMVATLLGGGYFMWRLRRL
ncbi:Fe(3+)-hydroxamate ABC transporter permease FhuB [Salinisphaera sp. T31B1]|uniref:Fe(3+)-hydroxamate ABC transporter permease FhuB n=1 Tax=Salinisphaera sp. T31B1 TaxID=727963 RepID=UPI003342C2D8